MDGASGNAGQDGSYDEPQVNWPQQGHEHFLPGMTADDRPPRRQRAGCVVLVQTIKQGADFKIRGDNNLFYKNQRF